ncbi:MAG: hypothetical protein JNK27_02930 [Chitinophagaceae bacterium]|nr:hypothetical protein [Chitinophagaceae bacterium]
MQERLFRFGITGLTFILAILFWFWFMGGHITNLISIKDEKIIALIIGLASTPALGFIVSSIGKELWEFLYPKQPFLFLNPEIGYAQKYFKLIHQAFPDSSGVKIRKDNKYQIADRKLVFLNQQVLLRKQNFDKEALAWTSRRMDVVYAQINGFYSIILGLIIAIFLFLFKYYYSINSFNFSIGKSLWIIPILSYIIISFKQAKRALSEANNFEKRFLLKIYESENSQVS